jgi:hypothetical protein
VKVPHFSEEEIAARRPVWIALSDLFLDTDSRLSYAYIARELAASPFTFDELHAIFLEEVSPVLEHNLMQVAGDWGMFPEEWLIKQILGRQGRSRKVWLWVDLSGEWRIVAALAGILRGLPEEVRLARSQAWRSLIMLFLDKKASNSFPPPPGFTLVELQGLYRNDLWPLLIPDVRRYAKQRPKFYPTEQDVENNWRDFATSRAQT